MTWRQIGLLPGPPRRRDRRSDGDDSRRPGRRALQAAYIASRPLRALHALEPATTILLSEGTPRELWRSSGGSASGSHRKKSLHRPYSSCWGLTEGAGIMRQYKDKVVGHRARGGGPPRGHRGHGCRDQRTAFARRASGPDSARHPYPRGRRSDRARHRSKPAARRADRDRRAVACLVEQSTRALALHSAAPHRAAVPGGNASRKGKPDGCEQREPVGLAARCARHGEPSDRDSREAGEPPRALSGAAGEGAVRISTNRIARPSGWSAACISSGRIRPA